MSSENLTLLFTAVVSLSTVVYVLLTWALVSETRKMRKAQVEPHVIAYLDIAETNAKIAYIKTANIGQGVALSVKFTIIKELDFPSVRKLSDYPYFVEGVKYFPPKHVDKHLLISFESSNQEAIQEPIIVEIEYTTILDEKRREKYELRLLELVGKGNLRPPDTHIGNIGYRLEKIEKLLEAQQNRKSE